MNEPTHPRVVLVHGWGGSAASTWHGGGLVGTLAAVGREVVAVDLPGHSPGTHSRDPADYADLASALDPALPADQVDGVGFSLGAKLLLELACRRPGRFRRLVLAGLGGNAFAPERAGEAVADALEQGTDTGTPGAVRAFAEYGTAGGHDPMALAACLRRPANPVLAPERLMAVNCPVLLIAGELDTVAQPLAPLADALTAVEIHAVPGATHLGLPADERFRRAVGEFLREKDD